jgi:hypothetical protein
VATSDPERDPPMADTPDGDGVEDTIAGLGEGDSREPAPFVPDETDAPKHPDTGEIEIDEPDPGGAPEPETGPSPPVDVPEVQDGER